MADRVEAPVLEEHKVRGATVLELESCNAVKTPFGLGGVKPVN